MFSPDELLNSGDSYINYYGYDIAGNKVAGNTNINDYFTKYDEKTKIMNVKWVLFNRFMYRVI